MVPKATFFKISIEPVSKLGRPKARFGTALIRRNIREYTESPTRLAHGSVGIIQCFPV
jgi:hypothetical protein